MRWKTIVAIGLLVCAVGPAGCLTDSWTPCPARGCPGRDAQVDAPGDRSPDGDAGMVLLRAGIGVLGGRLGTGDLTLSGTSFDNGGRSCIGRTCLAGGISP